MEKHTDNSTAQSNESAQVKHLGKACYTRRVDGKHVHLFKIARWTESHVLFVDDILPPMPRNLVDKSGATEADFAIVFDGMKDDPYAIQEAEYHRNYVHIDDSVGEVRRLRKAHRSSMFDAISALVAMKLIKALMDDEADAEEEGISRDYVSSADSLEELKPSIKETIVKALKHNAEKPEPKTILLEAKLVNMGSGKQENSPQITSMFIEAIEESLSDESATKGISYNVEMTQESCVSFQLIPRTDSE
tara:strand:+ start:59 stop:802 length:744 start_codon:yes stop_codon:yes gene_type:complete